jgi:hypothetical protein
MDCCEPPRHGSPRSVIVVAHNDPGDDDDDDGNDDDDREPLLSKGSTTTTAARRILGTTVAVTNRTLRVGSTAPDKSYGRSLLHTSTTEMSHTLRATTTLDRNSETPNAVPSAASTNGQCFVDRMPLRRLSLELLLHRNSNSNSNSNSSSHRRHSSTAISRTKTTVSASDTHSKRVRFLPCVTYFPADSPPTLDERMATWYTARDFKILKRALRNEILHAREAAVYNDYRHCFETVWHACNGRSSSSSSSSSTLESNDNDEEMATLWDWRDCGDGGNAAAVSLARPLAASRFRGLERAIFAQLVTTAQHRVATRDARRKWYKRTK